MKNITGVIVGAVLVIIVILGVLNYQKNNKDAGTLYIGITDATADIKGVTDIDMTVDKIEVYNSTKGWVTVSANPHTFSLLALKASSSTEFYAKGSSLLGSYDKVRVTLGDTVVRTKAKGNIKAFIPSSRLVIDTSLNIDKKGSAYLLLDFLADKSLHTDIDGKYVFAPVVKAELMNNAKVTVDGDNRVTVADGTIDDEVSVGMDLSGKSRTNFQLITGSTLIVESKEGEKVQFILGGELYTPVDDKDEVEASDDKSAQEIIDSNNSLKVNGSLGTELKEKDPIEEKLDVNLKGSAGIDLKIQ